MSRRAQEASHPAGHSVSHASASQSGLGAERPRSLLESAHQVVPVWLLRAVAPDTILSVSPQQTALEKMENTQMLKEKETSPGRRTKGSHGGAVQQSSRGQPVSHTAGRCGQPENLAEMESKCVRCRAPVQLLQMQFGARVS
jgi:hypothetical protein